MMKVEYVDHAYAAGFLEADGCVHISKNSVSVRITNRNTEVLRWFQKNYGGQVREKVKPLGCWEWNIHSDEALTFLGVVYKFLIFKKPQVDILIEFSKTKQKRGSRLSPEVISLRENLIQLMKKEKAQWRA